MKKIIFLFVLCISQFVNGQTPAFYNDVQQFKKQDSLSFPPRNAILFIGSSSFTMWRDVQEYFPGYQIINRGFGGSTLLDQLRYINDIVYPYHPRQIVIYCGENDLAASDTVDGKMVAERFKQLHKLIRAKYPKAYISYVSMKPSPSRQLLLPKMRDGNARIEEFLKKDKRATYIDVYSEMIDSDGKPVADLFLDDNLHMNSKGYAIWKKAIAPHLKK